MGASTMQNPFTPAFGGMPLYFFGRDDEIGFLKEAMSNGNGTHRAFFVTGNRGSGKTTLLERMSQVAASAKWKTVDVHSSHAVADIVRQIRGASIQTTEKKLSPSFAGISLGELSKTSSNEYGAGSLQEAIASLFGKSRAPKGLLITIDEIQKVPEPDAEAICAAIQLCLRKGHPVILALAGLVGSKQKVASYKGCTFMQRAQELRIGSLTIGATKDAFAKMFEMSQGAIADDDAILAMGRFSKGYPYLMQLIGYHAVSLIETASNPARINPEQIKIAEDFAYEDFKENVIVPTLSPLKDGGRAYLAAAAKVMDEDGRSSTRGIALELGKTLQECSSYRKRLIEMGILAADGYGYVRFGLPLLYRYFMQDKPLNRHQGDDEWRGR